MKIRLDKFLADCGIGTRSAVKAYIKVGRVTVNQSVAKSPEQKTDPDADEVCFDGRKLTHEEFQYYMLNKPQGVVSATEDQREKTVIDLITEEKRRDLFPVGRLDKDTEGLLLITNDGKLANALLAPGKHVDKCYYAELDREIPEDTAERFAEGVEIGDDTPTRPAELIMLPDGKSARLIITEGRYHQVKRMFEAVGCTVTYLKRLSMGTLSLDESLVPGAYRRLTEEELRELKENGK